MRKSTKGQKKIKKGQSGVVDSRSKNNISKTTDQQSTDPKVDIQQNPDGNNNLLDGKWKNEVQSWGKDTNLAERWQAIRDHFKAVRQEAEPGQHNKKSVTTYQSWTGVVEEISGNTLQIVTSSEICNVTSIYKETGKEITITVCKNYYDGITESFIEEERLDKCYNTSGISNYTKYRYYKEAIERGINILGKYNLNNNININNNRKLNQILGEVINKTTREMKGLYTAFVQEAGCADKEEDIRPLSNNIRNNYIRMLELINNENNRQILQSELIEFDKAYDSIVMMKRVNKSDESKPTTSTERISREGSNSKGNKVRISDNIKKKLHTDISFNTRFGF